MIHRKEPEDVVVTVNREGSCVFGPAGQGKQKVRSSSVRIMYICAAAYIQADSQSEIPIYPEKASAFGSFVQDEEWNPLLRTMIRTGVFF